MRQILKILFYNIAILFFVLGTFFFIPPTIFSIYEILIKKEANPHLYKSNLPNYKNIKWSKKHFQEYNRLKSKYFDYYGWRRSDFNGETINIKDGLRRTTQSKNIKDEYILWFFGGSTMWGTGVNDENTLPSLVAKETRYFSINFGESGYTSRQSLAYLNNLYSLKKNQNQKKKIIFLDGVNDVINNCRKEIKNIETYYQKEIRNMFFDKLSTNSLSYIATFNQWNIFIEKIKLYFKLNPSLEIDDTFDCHMDEEKAKSVANSLIENWISAKAIVEARGDEFIPILQPNAYLGETNTKHINLIKIYKLQYKKLYPLIKKIANERKIKFIDLTNIFNVNDLVYIDWCHVSPNGNIILKDKVSLIIN